MSLGQFFPIHSANGVAISLSLNCDTSMDVAREKGEQGELSRDARIDSLRGWRGGRCSGDILNGSMLSLQACL